MKPMRTKTNTEFVHDLMEYSEHGALMQMFVIECLTKWSDNVLLNRAELRSKWAISTINPDAWIRCAEEVKKKLEQKYSERN